MPSRLGEIPPNIRTVTARATVATLGPAGTDAHAEATRHFGRVLLADSFNAAMDLGLSDDVLVLIAAGFVERDEHTVVDSWVDMHFRNFDRMSLVATWESSTKPMCVAVNLARAASMDTMRSIAIHPATAAFARKFVPHATPRYVNAKPIAVQWAKEGRADGCIGSLDIVQENTELEVQRIWQPTMVWCLYEPKGCALNGT
ncbi:hypothetical protein OHA57_39010 (plasmid) [Streptomyces anulatus]|uniref:hypothetical protein n=1 Tax=Streptomyces anulatus TaxID=1892 RepID=UPI002DD8BC67|nr:hypothetical protein [Streptomyces anulatus]WSC66765.1 hypothetical protein OHA57_39010 [Streptomyces anulatus]